MTLLCYDEIWVREPRLMVPRRGPVNRVKVDQQNTFARNLLFSIGSFGGVTHNIVSGEIGVKFARTGTLPFVSPYDGDIASVVSGTTQSGNEFSGLSGIPVGSAITVAAIFSSSSNAGTWRGVMSKRDSEDANIAFDFRAYKDYSNNGTGKVMFSTRQTSQWRIWHDEAGLAVGSTQVVSISHTYGETTIRAFVNGAEKSIALQLNQSATGIPAQAANKVRTGFISTSDANGYAVSAIFLASAWGEMWSVGKHVEYYRDPYQFLIPA